MNSLARFLAPLLRLTPSTLPERQKELRGQYASGDGIEFVLPVNSHHSPVLMAAFPINAKAAAALLPGKELHPLTLGGKGVLMVTIVNYESTDIGKYIEYSLAIAVTHGLKPRPPLLPFVFQKSMGMGQFVVDLPVSTEISVKGGKGIWGMPKHQANLDFVIDERTVSAQYDLDGKLACYVEIEKPEPTGLPLKMAASNYCAFRGMLWKSDIYFEAVADVALGRQAEGRIVFGDSPRVAPFKTLGVGSRPLFTAWLPQTHGVLDDHFEAWFLTAESHEALASLDGGETLESVVGLGKSQKWLAPPDRSLTAGDRAAAEGRAS
ncbi:acetoacetate decarboxylase family protein [Sinomonas sp. JGH33]|uniref:Acetoacetate decarboxylase family protein n=1 Tax=Sinomonas terricola TaxID=3110330 RepID=A0ABU5TAH0_9MICC|nr:acetoacetate decarboxylase family protein [Sinomonas sp. JGH33]MEA5456654.1 acetoacetate decarboxylase family protein [Sinomonas sp. JGH33]